jgi:hypothetical protein
LPRIGITGHMNLTPPTETLVKEALHGLLAPYADGDLVGVSCLARGADQLFARAVLDIGGRLEVVLPTSTYREQKVKQDNLATFDELLDHADHVHTMPFTEANRDAYEAANNTLLGTIERLVAVWDGEPSADQGGTGATVIQARQQGTPVDILWPEGAARG